MQHSNDTVLSNLTGSLELVHTSTLAQFGTVRYDKNRNVNAPTTEPYQTGSAYSIKPGWHGTVRLLLKQRIEIIIIPLSLLLSWRQQQTGLAKKPSNLSACGAKKNALSSQVSVAQFLAVSVHVSTYDAFLACLLFLRQKIFSKTVVNKLTTNPSLTIHGKRTDYNNNNIQYALLQMCYLRVRSCSVNRMRFRTVPYRTELNRASVLV